MRAGWGVFLQTLHALTPRVSLLAFGKLAGSIVQAREALNPDPSPKTIKEAGRPAGSVVSVSQSRLAGASSGAVSVALRVKASIPKPGSMVSIRSARSRFRRSGSALAFDSPI